MNNIYDLTTSMKRTSLYHIHKKLNAKISAFAGFEMPIQYSSIIEEHKRVRSTVGIFDVSHMGELEICGDNALSMVQKVTINDASLLNIGQCQYSAMCYDDGGLVDDLLVYRFPDHYLLVVNAANKDKDFNWLLKQKIDRCEIIDRSDQTSQIAVQGKMSQATLQKLTNAKLDQIKYYHFIEDILAGLSMVISRTGYTGEPGFELYFPNEYAEDIWYDIMKAGEEFDIQPIGLAARDTLRLEKNMRLYGSDMDQNTNPLEAGLDWIIKFNKEDFIGRKALLAIKEKGLQRKLAAFILKEGGFPRHGYEIYKENKKIGYITSGTVSPLLNRGIGLGYVIMEYANIGTDITIKIRDRFIKAEVIKPPFV
jgi:aminomethyltransferase